MTNRRRFATMGGPLGWPDGAAVDAQGGYWIAALTVGFVHHFSADGRLIESIPVPAAPTMVCFGGPDLRTLYVTSIWHMRSAEQIERWPLTGSVFTGPAPVAGTPVHRFADR